MKSLREIIYRTANAALLGSLSSLHRRFNSPTTYKVGQHGAAALFEDCWFAFHPREFGCTGNIDYVPDAENATRAALFNRIEDRQVFYDIGAHGGVYTITLIKRFPDVIVHSFEPQPEELLENLELNDMACDRVHAAALGENNGTVRMTTKERSSNHISDTGTRIVPIIRLDDYVTEKNLPCPNWIKIDIEGMELPALKGAEQILRKSRPTIICEINHISGRYGSTVADINNFLKPLGYLMYSLIDSHLVLVTDENIPYSANWNYWFVAS